MTNVEIITAAAGASVAAVLFVVGALLPDLPMIVVSVTLCLATLVGLVRARWSKWFGVKPPSGLDERRSNLYYRMAKDLHIHFDGIKQMSDEELELWERELDKLDAAGRQS